MLRMIAAWAAATLAVYVVGSVSMTQLVLAALHDFGVDVDLKARVWMTLADLGGLALSYLPLVAIAMAVALLLAGWLGRAIPGRRRALVLLAGITAPPSLVGIMTLAFGMNPLAGATGSGALALQSLAGLAGSFVFLGITDTSPAGVEFGN